MEKVLSKDELLAKQGVFRFILLMSGFLAICTAIVFVAFLFVPNSGTAPEGVIFMSYLFLAAMPVGFFAYIDGVGKRSEKLT